MSAKSVCVIGAGPSGITAAKNILDVGITDLVVYDRGKDVGGNWVFDDESKHSSVFETTHIISSKHYSGYEDFPMPSEYPDYPGHRHLAKYFKDYADHFGLYGYIEFDTYVNTCKRLEDGRWQVATRQKGQTNERIFDELVVCNGHHWEPRYPQYPGTFEGEIIHSHDFKRAASFKDKRVLVVGGGNSACDVAVETSRISQYTDVSMRRGYWIVPKFMFGKPTDELHNAAHKLLGFLPLKWRRYSLQWLLKRMNGGHGIYGMEQPDHNLFETHPTINSELLYFIRHGEVSIKTDIAKFEGKTVHFKGGESKDYDAIIYCTGFVISHPFFDQQMIDYSSGPVPLYLKMFHPQYNNLSFVGLFQPLGCIWPASELQAKILARRLIGEWNLPEDMNAAIQNELDNPDVEQLNTPRHTITVDYPVFRKKLLRHLPDHYVSKDRKAPEKIIQLAKTG